MNAGMERRYCGECRRQAWHNKKKEGWRCTFCGAPATTNPAKREYQQLIIRTQAAKP